MEEHCCDYGHDHGHVQEKTTKIPLTMENLDKGVKNLNILIDMIDSRQDEKKEAMIIYIKCFIADLVKKLKGEEAKNDTEKKEEEKKEPEIPLKERINKTLLQILQIKPAAIIKYGDNFLGGLWELSDDLNNYELPEELKNQQSDKRLSALEIMKYFLQLLFGASTKVESIIDEQFILLEKQKRKVMINEEKLKELSSTTDKVYDNNFLCNLMIIKILTHVKLETIFSKLYNLVMTLNNNALRLYRLLSLFSFSLWNSNSKEKYIKKLLYLIGGVLKEYGRIILKIEGIDVNKLIYFTEFNNGEHLFPDVDISKKEMSLLKDYLLPTVVNFIAIFFLPYDTEKSYEMQDGNYWDEYHGLILRLKDPKLTASENEQIPRRIPLSLDLKCYIILFISDFLFFFYTHLCRVKDNKIETDFANLECLNYFCKYAIISSNYNILVFFQRNIFHPRFNEMKPHKMEYELKDNFNSYGLFLILYMLLIEKKVPFIINKNAYIATITESLKVVLKKGKDYGIPIKKDELLFYYVQELHKNKFLDLGDDDFKSLLYQTSIKKELLDKIFI